MAWIFLVNGLSYTVSVGEADPYDVSNLIENTEEYRALETYAKENGCCLNVSVDCEDRNEVSVFAGVELWPDRCIYQGQTIIADKPIAPELVEYFDQKLYELLVEKLALKADVAHGIVLNQFD